MISIYMRESPSVRWSLCRTRFISAHLLTQAPSNSSSFHRASTRLQEHLIRDDVSDFSFDDIFGVGSMLQRSRQNPAHDHQLIQEVLQDRRHDHRVHFRQLLRRRHDRSGCDLHVLAQLHEINILVNWHNGRVRILLFFLARGSVKRKCF